MPKSAEWYNKPVRLGGIFHGGTKTRANYQLTQLGTTKAEQINVSGTKGEVVMALENIGPCTISELANEAKLSPAKVKQAINVLVRDGWAQKTAGED